MQTYDDGSSFVAIGEGSSIVGGVQRRGKGTYHFADGRVALCAFSDEHGEVVGPCVIFSATREQAWRMDEPTASAASEAAANPLPPALTSISIEEADALALAIGLVVPEPASLVAQAQWQARTLAKATREKLEKTASKAADTTAAKQSVAKAKALVESMSPKKNRKSGNAKVAPEPPAAVELAATQSQAGDKGKGAVEEAAEGARSKTSVDKAMYEKFERDKQRPPGNASHEYAACALVLLLVVVPAAYIAAFPVEFSACDPPGWVPQSWVDEYAPEINCTAVALQKEREALAATRPPPPPAVPGYYGKARQSADKVLSASNYAFTVAWPSAWLGLVVLGLCGRIIDTRYRPKDHEVMRFRYDGLTSLGWGVLNLTVYVLVFSFFVLILGRNLVTDFLFLVIKCVIAVCAIALSFASCVRRAEDRRQKSRSDSAQGGGAESDSDTPMLRDVVQVKLDCKFQSRVEGHRKYNKRQLPLAAKAFASLASCGLYKDVKPEPPPDRWYRPPEGVPGTYTGPRNAKGEKEGARGVETFVDGTRYVGGFLAGLRHGYGMLTFGDGSSYEGGFEAGLQDGVGTVRFAGAQTRPDVCASVPPPTSPIAAAIAARLLCARCAACNAATTLDLPHISDIPQRLHLVTRLADGTAQVSKFVIGNLVGASAFWSASRVEVWKTVGWSHQNMTPITRDEAAAIAKVVGQPIPPVHDEGGAQAEAEALYSASHRLGATTRLRTYVYCLLTTITLGLGLKLAGLMWFFLRALMALPLYGCVPRLYYIEWFVHFHQKHLISFLDYPSVRPTMPNFAPFFFSVYLPNMGVHLPGIKRPDAKWPDADWPRMEWPKLRLPAVQMGDLMILLRLRFPNVVWPQAPHAPWPGPIDIPSIDLRQTLPKLRLSYPTLTWPALPSGSALAFPDFNLPNLSLSEILAQMRISFPDLALPDLPLLEPHTFSLGDLLQTFRLRLPELAWPTITPPKLSLADLRILLQLRFPSANWPEIPAGVDLPEGLILPSFDLSLVLPALRAKFPSMQWPALPEMPNGCPFPDWSFPGIDVKDLLADLRLALPSLNFPVLPEMDLPGWRLPDFSMSDLLRTFQLRWPDLVWPDASLPTYSGLSLSVLGLRVPSISGFGLPDPRLSLRSLNLDLPQLRLPAIDFQMPHLEVPDVSLPNVQLPTIPIPSLGYPELDLELEVGNCCPIATNMLCSLLADLADDLKDFVLIFGTTLLLYRKVMVRKTRARAQHLLVAGSGVAS